MLYLNWKEKVDGPYPFFPDSTSKHTGDSSAICGVDRSYLIDIPCRHMDRKMSKSFG